MEKPDAPMAQKQERSQRTASSHQAWVRCPFCHTCVDMDEEDWVACRGCLARHHLACWGEAGACSTCQRTDFMPATTAREPVPLRRVLVPTAVGALLGAIGGGPSFGCLGLCVAELLLRGLAGEGADHKVEAGLAAVSFALRGAIYGYAGGWVAYKLARRSRQGAEIAQRKPMSTSR